MATESDKHPIPPEVEDNYSRLRIRELLIELFKGYNQGPKPTEKYISAILENKSLDELRELTKELTKKWLALKNKT